MRKLAVLCFAFLLAMPAMAQPLTQPELVSMSHQTWAMLDDAVTRGDITSKEASGHMADLGYVIGLLDRPDPSVRDIAQAEATLGCIAKTIAVHGLKLPETARVLQAWLQAENNRQHAEVEITKCPVA